MTPPTAPAVAGHFARTLADFEHSCLVHLSDEQGRANPDNALIATLCDAVRLAREHAEALARPMPISTAPAIDPGLLVYLQHKPTCSRLSHRRSDDGGWTFAFPPEPCTCGLDALLAARAPQPAHDIELLAQAIEKYAEWCGGVHDDGCPSDDTCECGGKWINDGITAAVNYLRSRAARAPQPEPETGWRPIESAPKDGRRLLLYGCEWSRHWFGSGYYFKGVPGDGEGWIASSFLTQPHNDSSGSFNPSHWMPMLAAPAVTPDAQAPGAWTRLVVSDPCGCERRYCPTHAPARGEE